MDKALDQQIVEAADDVYAQLGGGLSECIYQAALAIALRQRGYGIETEVVVPILYDNSYVGFVRPDIVINKEVVLELKSVTRVVESHLVQLRAYLRWLPRPPPDSPRMHSAIMGALINFGPTEVHVEYVQQHVAGSLERVS